MAGTGLPAQIWDGGPPNVFHLTRPLNSFSLPASNEQPVTEFRRVASQETRSAQTGVQRIRHSMNLKGGVRETLNQFGYDLHKTTRRLVEPLDILELAIEFIRKEPFFSSRSALTTAFWLTPSDNTSSSTNGAASWSSRRKALLRR